MALLSFVESAPRAYRLKASNAASPILTSSGTIPKLAERVALKNGDYGVRINVISKWWHGIKGNDGDVWIA
jgi:hypothetical protein